MLLACPLSAQEPKTEFAEGQRAEETVAFLPGDSNVSESPVDIMTLPSSGTLQRMLLLLTGGMQKVLNQAQLFSP